MAVNTLDDLADEKYEAARLCFENFRASKKTSSDQQNLYDELTNLGLSPESADEYVNLELEA